MRQGAAAPAPLSVVGIGASAGGIEAFRGFFENMPAESGLAFVVVLHLPIDRKSLLPELLARWTSMAVVVATHGCVVEANTIYVPPPGVVVTLSDGRLRLHELPANEPRELSPISMLFNSLAEGLREDAIGVVLSGTGSDGALGLKAIKEKGGLTLAQGSDGTAPQFEGMPSSAIATGAVDIVAPVEAMPAHILAVQTARRAQTGLEALSPAQIESARLAICDVLQRQIGHDFSGYKDKTFLRRVQRRMQVLSLVSLDAFVDRLKNDRHEVVMLFRDLLIGVTSFFRDEGTFDALRQTVMPRLFEGKGVDSTLRVWIPGCATGEEAYSLAILLLEHASGLDGRAPKLQIFATDIDEAAIGTARAGRYPSTLLQGLSPQRLARFFVQGIDGSYSIAKTVREICTFSAHSLTRDPPFSRIDMVSCRNLLIYMDIDLQATVIPAFHYSLVPDGILLLGSSETVNRHEGLFTTLDRGHRIFQKRDIPTPPLALAARVNARPSQPAKDRSQPTEGVRRSMGGRSANWAETRVLERFAPAFVVATADGHCIQYSSRLGGFLELAPGLPSQNVLVMARPGLRAPLQSALRQAVESGKPVEKSGVSLPLADGEVQRVTLTVEPRREQGSETLYLIVFSEGGPSASEDAVASLPHGVADVHLEAELRETREQLRSVTEEHETALEELRSANEELHSVNEEFQSTNEELETSKEEIQSINEELQTVNGQLAGKVEELNHRNTDLKNLFESTQVATIFLDQSLVIRSFTPAVATIYNLIPSDHGRPLTDIVSRLTYAGLREDCRRVLESLESLETRVAREDGATHYLMKMLPYRAPDSTADGIVITFVDVTSIVQAEQHQRLLVDELNHRVKNMLTVVISMAIQTLRRSETLEEFSRIYLGRVNALTAAYSLLSMEGWQTVPLRQLLLEELKPFQSADHDNILLDGPHVPLEPRAALALGMAVHELTTNAVKYGALSSVEGNVRVVWRVRHHESGDELVLDWLESGGPPVAPPSHRGFGMTLIERGLRQDMSARVEVEFAATGVTARLTAPLKATPPLDAPVGR